MVWLEVCLAWVPLFSGFPASRYSRLQCLKQKSEGEHTVLRRRISSADSKISELRIGDDGIMRGLSRGGPSGGDGDLPRKRKHQKQGGERAFPRNKKASGRSRTPLNETPCF